MAGRHVRCPKCEASVDVPAIVDEPELMSEAEDLPTDSLSNHSIDRSPVLTLPATFAAPSIPNASVPNASIPNASIPSAAGQAEADDDEDEEPVLARNKRPEEEMDMTPMVDVTFLLLIFFMVTAAFSLQKSIEMPRQQTDAPSTSVVEEESEDKDMVEVQVDEYGSFLVMAPDWERETPGKQNLISTLKEAAGNNSDGMRLVIKVHEMAKLSALVDCMDAGTIAGYAQLEVTQVEEFD